MNSILVNYPVTPELTMNLAAQYVALANGVIGMLICLIIGWRMSVKYKTPLPFLFPIAGACDVVLEPVICFLGHAVHAQIGQITLFETNTRPIPVHVALLYGVYYGPVWLFLFHRFMTTGLSNAFLWKTFVVLFVFAQLFEIAPVNYGLWYHYGYQPFRFGDQGEPLFFPVVNLVPAYLGFLLIINYRHLLSGWRALFIIPLTQAGAYMGHLGAGFPYYNVINSSASPAMIQLACVASILLALAFIAAINQSLSAASSIASPAA